NLTGGPRRHKSGEGRLFLTQKMIAHWDDADPEAVFIANWSMVQATGFKFYQAINRRIVTFSTAQGSFDFFTSRILAQTLVNMAHDATGCRHDLIV
ncbi:MAG TPA: hypothetical protein VMT88_12475, partial [Actinomycetes bacterium]|nr:hypothetical protein [Actinomycetes bacterium]